MKITFLVDQKAALRAGVDAPSSTVVLDVDPAGLTQEHRDLIAEALEDGHRATRAIWRTTRICNHAAITLRRPTMDGLIAALDQRLADRAEVLRAEKAKEERADARHQSAIADLRERLRRGETERHTVRLERDGISVTRQVTVPADTNLDGLPEDLREQLARSQAERKAICDQAKAELQLELDQKIRERDAAREATQAEYDALYARLPETLRERDGAGWAEKNEVENALRGLIRSDAGYERPEAWKRQDRVTRLTDAQFARLKEIEAGAPNGAKVEVLDVSDGGGRWRPATDEDDEEDIDDDHEVWVEPVNPRRLALISWSRGGVATSATVRLPD